MTYALRPWDVERVCPVCETRYTPSKSNYHCQVTCSACRAPTDLEPWDVERVCPVCETRYTPSRYNHRRQRFCSGACGTAYRDHRRFERYKEQELCVDCGGEKDTVIIRCAACSDRDAASSRRWREERRENDECVRCGYPLPLGSIADGHDVCPGCTEEARIYEETGDYTYGRERGEGAPPNPIETELEET